jgi:hypothetical protein
MLRRSASNFSATGRRAFVHAFPRGAWEREKRSCMRSHAEHGNEKNIAFPRGAWEREKYCVPTRSMGTRKILRSHAEHGNEKNLAFPRGAWEREKSYLHAFPRGAWEREKNLIYFVQFTTFKFECQFGRAKFSIAS